MKIFIKIAFLLLLISNSTEAFSRERLLDNKDVCERHKGVWREFGNNCADHCYTKNKVANQCISYIVFNCDCGENRCWDINRCTSIKRYKIEIDRRLQRKIERQKIRLEKIEKLKKAEEELIEEENKIE